MHAADFDFALPPERIARHPARPRDAARLLQVGQALHDRTVRDLPDLLRPGDILVANDTKVIPAQLTAYRGQARIGITLDRPLPDGTWHALARNARRLQAGDVLRIDGAADFSAVVRTRDPDGGVILAFSLAGDAFADALRRAGALALPPYIGRTPTEQDAADYQTVFARHEGAVAAPTAGLHFTPALLDALAARGIARTTVTLHVGAGTFLPLRDDNLDAHTLHAERGELSPAAAAAINGAKAAGGRIVAVGTTTLRLLETAAGSSARPPLPGPPPQGGREQAACFPLPLREGVGGGGGTPEILPFHGETRIFIRPGHVFRTADLLLTNFHLPRSTLFMLVCAFAGTARMRAAYAHAIAVGYRFYSYGDACLLERA
jgi:S-adenosylmethionine:tRNA ribosyltransferase-isomerase